MLRKELLSVGVLCVLGACSSSGSKKDAAVAMGDSAAPRDMAVSPADTNVPAVDAPGAVDAPAPSSDAPPAERAASDAAPAGTDAAARDAGATDARPVDAAGATDAAAADAAAPDAAPADAATAMAMLGLTMADKPGVAPCPSQAILTDSTAIEGLKTAMRDGVITYLDLPFNGADPDIYKKKCGLEGFWDPAVNVNPIPSMGTPKLATILTTGHGGICSTGFANFGTDEGFPVAGVYRKEFKAAYMGATYHVRVRVTSAGPAAGQKFSANGIAVPNDIQNTLMYKVAGATVAHDGLWAAIANALAASTTQVPTVDFAADKAGANLFTSKIEVLCAAKM